MAKSRTRKTQTTSARARRNPAKRQPKQTSRGQMPQERGSGQDQKLIGAERYPRKGDDDEDRETE